MPTSITKFAPQAILLAVAVYWSWPSLSQSVSRPKPSAAKDDKALASLAFPAGVLSPTFPSAPKRDPFLPPGAKPSSKGKKGTPSAAEAATLVAAEAKDPGLVLNATCIVGQQRLAIINGRVYREKESIQTSGEATVPWVVTAIYPHKVMLSHQGMPLQLGYTNVAMKPSAAPAAATGPGKGAK
jgi:hypothetical protein